MLYMVTFTINTPQMLAYIPYMDPMGYSRYDRNHIHQHQLLEKLTSLTNWGTTLHLGFCNQKLHQKLTKTVLWWFLSLVSSLEPKGHWMFFSLSRLWWFNPSMCWWTYVYSEIFLFLSQIHVFVEADYLFDPVLIKCVQLVRWSH